MSVDANTSQEPNEVRRQMEYSVRYGDDYFNTFTACLNVVEQAQLAHARYWRYIDYAEKHIRGDRPRDPKKLKKAGMAFSNNWNFCKARAKITGDVAENIARIRRSIALNIPKFRRPKKTGEELDFLSSEDDRGVVSMKLSRVFSDMLDREYRFSEYLNKVEYPAYAFGFSAVTFDGMDDWLGDPVHPRHIAFEDKTEPDKIQTFVIFDVIKAQELWDRWLESRKTDTKYVLEEADTSRETDISATNWSVKGLEAVLYNALRDEIRQNYLKEGESNKGWINWEDVLRDFYTKPAYYVQNTKNVYIAKIFHKELNGKWTETYIPYANPWQSAASYPMARRSGAHTRFQTGDMIIYKDKRGRVSQDDIIVLVKESGFSEQGFIAEFRGAAKFAVEDSVRHNKKRNNIEDKLIFAGSPMFMSPNTQQEEMFKIVPSQGFTLVQQGFNLLPDQPTFDLSQHILSLQLDDQNYARETAQFNPKVQGRLTSRPVKDEVQQISREVEQSRGSKSDVKIADWSRLCTNILWNLGKIPTPDREDIGRKGYDYFYNELEYELDAFIPEGESGREWIKKLVAAVVDVRIEDFLADQEALQLAISMAETSYARNRLKRMLLMAQGFPRTEIDRIAPLPTDSMRNLRDERVASMENDILSLSRDAIVTEEDDHIDHLNIHYKKVTNIFEGVQQQRLDPVHAFKWASNILIHADLHLRAMSQDPTLQRQYEALLRQYEAFTQQLGQLKSIAQQVLKQRQEAAQQPQPMGEKERRETEIKERESQAKMQRTDALTVHKAQANERETQHRHRLEEIELAHEMNLEQVEARHEENIKAIKAAADLID